MKRPGAVLIFEDDPKFATSLARAIRARVGTTVNVTIFAPRLNRRKEETFEDRLKVELLKPANGVHLWVTDRDLSATQSLIGFSESAVSRVANEWAIPVCLYARGTGNSLLDRQRNWAEGRIILDANQGPAEMARQIGIIYKGFATINVSLGALLSHKRTGRQPPLTPARMLAHLLGKPAVADKVAQYGSGDQKVLADLLPFKNSELQSRIPRILGYWLWDAVLRFPGILVNEVAAASYLDIDPATFKKNRKLQHLFRSALYEGPFADDQNKLWWRTDLDTILLGQEVSSGYNLCKKLKIGARHCYCCVDPNETAGYYCMIRKEPVSYKHSNGNISWFPPGADLARVSTPVYKEIGPWVGLF